MSNASSRILRTGPLETAWPRRITVSAMCSVSRAGCRPPRQRIAYGHSNSMNLLRVRIPPTTVSARSIGGTHFHIGLLQSTAGQHEAAVRSWTTALENFRAAAELGPSPLGMTLSTAEVLAQLGQWKEAADTLAASIDRVDYAWKPRCQFALLQWMAGDEEGYRATCRELISRHGSDSTALESAGIAMICLIDPKAVDDWNSVLRIAQHAASTDSPDFGYQYLIGAAQYRAGNLLKAQETLEGSQPGDESADFSTSPQLCAAVASHALGDTVLTLIDRELRNDEAFARHHEELRKLVGSLKSTTPQYCDDGERWRIGVAILHARARVGNPPARDQTVNSPTIATSRPRRHRAFLSAKKTASHNRRFSSAISAQDQSPSNFLALTFLNSYRNSK